MRGGANSSLDINGKKDEVCKGVVYCGWGLADGMACIILGGREAWSAFHTSYGFQLLLEHEKQSQNGRPLMDMGIRGEQVQISSSYRGVA